MSIRRYKSIEDGSEFPIERDVTSLVGKNESGKSAALQALYKSYPVEPHVAFDAGLDYPTTKSRERKAGGKIPVTILSYELDAVDALAVEAELGEGVLMSRSIAVTTGYNYKASAWGLKIDETAVVNHLRKTLELAPSEQSRVDAAKSVSELTVALRAVEAPISTVQDTIDKIAEWPDSDPLLAAINILVKLRPKFVYFDDYDSMPGKVSIPDLVLKRNASTLERSEQAVVSLLSAAGAELEDFLEPESHEHLIRDSENASNAISDEVFQYWSQNKNLAVKITLIAATTDNSGTSQGPWLQIRVENQRHHVTVPFDERSRGFVWFFSFLTYFSSLEEKSEQPLILLLDEPGINLHASAQADLLRFIDERLAPKHQVIFSTHSPFMIDPHAINRVRTVIDRDNEGTKISDDVFYADSETAFPLHAAMGVELAQTLFVAPDTLVVEGPSDLMYLEVLSQKLESLGRGAVDSRWAMAPIGGVAKLPAFVSLLGANRLNIAVLADSSMADRDAIERLERAGKLSDAGVVLISDIVGRPEADVEDIFDVSFYLKLVNGSYSEQLGENPIKVSDLSKGDGVTQRIGEVFKARGINRGKLNHFKPAKYLLEKPSRYKIPAATLDRAESLIKKINSHLPS